MKEKNKAQSIILGALLLSVGMQFANYGTAVCVSGEVSRMNAMQYYVLVNTMGSLGMMLILPVVGNLTAIFGQRTLILLGILIQFGGRLVMMASSTVVPYSIAFLLQAVGGGLYISAPFILIAGAVEERERAKYFGYIAVANAVGAIFGPIMVSMLYAGGGILSKVAYIANLPLTLIGFLLVFSACPNQKRRDAAKGFDTMGLLLTVLGVACLVFWLNLGGKMFDWLSLTSAVLLAAAILALGAMIRRERKIDNPAVPVRMFRNPRLTYAFIGSVVASAYATCSASYSVMWIRLNYSGFAASSFYNGTATMMQNLVILILGFFLGAYVGKEFQVRFRRMGIASMAAAMLATGILYCLKFTGTAEGADLIMVTSGLPLGMLLIYVATAIGGFTSVVAQSTFSAFWQSNTPREEIPAGQALYNFGATGGSCIFGAIVGVVLGNSTDYSRAFATGFVFALIGLVCAIVGFRFTDKTKADSK